MNSIRPFATVMVLVVIGIGLYMVINSSEPIPPDEASDGMLAIPEIEDELEALVQGGSPDGYSAGAPTSPFPTHGELAPAPQWSPSGDSSAAPEWPEDAVTSSAPPLPQESAGSPLPPSAGDSSTPAEQASPITGQVNAFSQQLANQVQGADAPQSVANPYVSTGLPGQHLGNIPSPEQAQQLASRSNPPSSPHDAHPGLPVVAEPPGGGYPMTRPAAGELGGLPGQAAGPVEEGAAQRPTTSFAVVRAAVQESLRRGELSQSLLMLSEFYGDPQLTAEETRELHDLLSQLAGTVIYSTSHELEQPYRVRPGETLADIAEAYQVTPELLAKINGLVDPSRLSPGTELKVVRGPFTAILDESVVRLMLDGRYAGRFPAQGPSSWAADSWTVQQKVPAGNAATPEFASSGKHVVLAPAEPGSNVPPVAIVSDSAVGGVDRPVVRVSQRDLDDLYDLLTIGSRVTVRR